jgi:hypothetical protein
VADYSLYRVDVVQHDLVVDDVEVAILLNDHVHMVDLLGRQSLVIVLLHHVCGFQKTVFHVLLFLNFLLLLVKVLVHHYHEVVLGLGVHLLQKFDATFR